MSRLRRRRLRQGGVIARPGIAGDRWRDDQGRWWFRELGTATAERITPIDTVTIMVLDVDRYRATVDPGLAAATVDWLCRIAPAAKADGGMVTYDGATLVRSIRWVDERCEMQLLVDTTEVEQIWWVPPEPPPAELMRYAERVRSSDDA